MRRAELLRPPPMQPQPSEPLLELRALRLELAGRTVLAIDRLELARPGITVVLGPNGAGKTVLLHALQGLLAPAAGSIRLRGARDTPRTALLFQKPVLLRRTVAANLRYVLARRRLARVERRRLLEELLRLCELEPLAHRPARRLSGGEQQRVALAMALARDPDLLLLDEPTASLDPTNTARFEALVGRIRDRGTRILLVTHDVAQARRLADEVVFLHRGRILEHAPARRFFRAPASPIARAYLEGGLVP